MLRNGSNLIQEKGESFELGLDSELDSESAVKRRIIVKTEQISQKKYYCRPL